MKYLLILMIAMFISGCGDSKKVEAVCPECDSEIIVDVPEPIPEPVLPCPDTRNGDFDPSYPPQLCNSNGYFWCSLARQCLNKPINVNACGEIGSQKRESINNGSR